MIDGILSIQSSVAYGYVGNKAAVYPLQRLGYDVYAINTVQFSNHTGYDFYEGDIFDADHVKRVAQGLLRMDVAMRCRGIISGYMGSESICNVVRDIVNEFKRRNPKILYLCDPVVSNPDVAQYFKKSMTADIITPNMQEAQLLSGVEIGDESSIIEICRIFHGMGVRVVIVTGVEFAKEIKNLHTFLSLDGVLHVVCNVKKEISSTVHGMGDLFAAVYMGHYLRHRNEVLALEYAVDYVDTAVMHTNKDDMELAVLRVK